MSNVKSGMRSGLRKRPNRFSNTVISEVSVAFFLLDMLEDLSAKRRVEVDPVWTTMGALGVLLFAVMWTRKKLRRRPT